MSQVRLLRHVLPSSTYSFYLVPIGSIKELRLGEEGRYYRMQFKLPEQYEDRRITIIYIVDGRTKYPTSLPRPKNHSSNDAQCSKALCYTTRTYETPRER